MKKVLALKVDGTMSFCTCPPERRGIGRCNHVAHQEDGETETEFLMRVQDLIYTDFESESDRLDREEEEFDMVKEVKLQEEITTNVIQENILSFNENPDWSEEISPELLSRFLRIGQTAFDGKVIVKQEVNEYGDTVDHLYIVGEYDGFEFYEGAEDDAHKPCDFGCIPHVAEDGSISICGIDYRCLPVLGRDKVGYGQGFSKDGKETIWIYQEDGNLAITVPVEGDTCKIFGRTYTKKEIEEAVCNGHYEYTKGKTEEENQKVSQQINLLISSIDPMIAERLPEYGKEGWMGTLCSRFEKDRINDVTYRRVYTMKDQVMKELQSQLRRMGNTLRKSIVDGKDPILYQQNNTENIMNMLRNRSNVQMAEKLNPLAAFSQAHKVTMVGLEGYSKDNCPDPIRMVNDSLRGICDPLDQSSGKGVGTAFFLKGSDIKNGVIVKTPDKPCYSLSDFVPFTRHNNPNRVSMATSQMRQAMPLIHGEDPRKLGDATSDGAWSQISGAKIGVNLRTVYLTGEKQWEDSATISESAARKMLARKSFKFPNDGRFHDGQFVHAGDKIGGHEVKYDGVIRKTKSGSFQQDVTVPFIPGNKIAGRYGNKCTIGEIRPDDQMPEIWNPETKSYERAEVIMSPLSIGKRGNIGTILETQNGSMATKDIVPVRMPNGKTVKANNGFQFIMRLNQISQEKNHSHGGELTEGREARSRLGEMENILLTTTESRRKVMHYLKHQGTDESARLDSLLKSIGIKKK